MYFTLFLQPADSCIAYCIYYVSFSQLVLATQLVHTLNVILILLSLHFCVYDPGPSFYTYFHILNGNVTQAKATSSFSTVTKYTTHYYSICKIYVSLPSRQLYTAILIGAAYTVYSRPSSSAR